MNKCQMCGHVDSDDNERYWCHETLCSDCNGKSFEMQQDIVNLLVMVRNNEPWQKVAKLLSQLGSYVPAEHAPDGAERETI